MNTAVRQANEPPLMITNAPRLASAANVSPGDEVDQDSTCVVSDMQTWRPDMVECQEPRAQGRCRRGMRLLPQQYLSAIEEHAHQQLVVEPSLAQDASRHDGWQRGRRNQLVKGSKLYGSHRRAAAAATNPSSTGSGSSSSPDQETTSVRSQYGW